MKLKEISVDPVQSILGSPELTTELEIVAKWTDRLWYSGDDSERVIQEIVKDIEMILHVNPDTDVIKLTEIVHKTSGRSFAWFDNEYGGLE
ncbi:MAG: hypothetical protein JKY95_14790 [Planctomycetaceae bacterium]|nr:hypothetical protein [Planctomycetaceae bacterium]